VVRRKARSGGNFPERRSGVEANKRCSVEEVRRSVQEKAQEWR
jgi:hypothetical protein